MDANLHIQELWTATTQTKQIGQSESDKTFSGNMGDLLDQLRDQYGRVISRVYLDSATGDQLIAFVFQQKIKADSATVIRQTFVTIRQNPVNDSLICHFHLL